MSSGTAANGGFTFGSLAAFLTNRPLSFTSQIPGPNYSIDRRQTVVGAYAQDDWRARPNLTVNLGLRYELATVPTETANRLSTLTNITDAQTKIGSPYFQNSTSRDLSPRVGISWDPARNGKTAVRGAFGIYDTLPLTYQFNLLTIGTAPFSGQGQVINPPPGSFPKNAIQLLNPLSSRVTYVEQNPKRSSVEQWNVNIQRQVREDLTVQMGYTGSHGVHQPFRTQDTDIVLPVQTSQGFQWPQPRGSGTRLNPNVGQIQALVWQVSTSYHALHLQATRRMRRGFQVGSSYTWAKSIDSGSATGTGGQFGNSLTGLPIFWPQLRRGLSDFDVRNNVVVNYLWALPAPSSVTGFRGLITRGWQWGGILQASNGQPFTILIGGDPLGLNSSQNFDFPNRLAGPGCKSLVNPSNPDHYLRTSCFGRPSPTTLLGNSGRNVAIGPGLVDFDFSLFKDIPLTISENSRIQFRAEFFNALNHPNFNPPSGAQAQVFNQSFNPVGTFGKLTQTSTTSRQIQFGLKLIW